MSEEQIGVAGRYNLETFIADWAGVELVEEAEDRWSFTVAGREEGRKIALEFSKELGRESHLDYASRITARLEDPEPIDDLRINGGQTSFSEYDDDFNSKGPITLVELYVRNSSQDPEGLQNFKSAVSSLIDRISAVKKP